MNYEDTVLNMNNLERAIMEHVKSNEDKYNGLFDFLIVAAGNQMKIDKINKEAE